MDQITYLNKKMIAPDELKNLFDSVGWAQNLTPDQLQCAIFKSSHSVSAWNGKKLVGLIRSMNDDIYSSNIDLLLVHKDYQHQGIATNLIKELLSDIKHIQYISTSPNERKNFHLYQQFGFEEITDSGLLQMENIR